MRRIIISAISLCIFTPFLPLHADEPAKSAAEIVAICGHKYQGEDQRSRLTISFKDAQGQRDASQYLRLWKDFHGHKGIVDKVVIVTERPHDAKNVTFMRWSYRDDTGKDADQWVYLPELRTLRRVSKRDPNNLAWGFSDNDLRGRPVEEQQHKLLHTDTIGNKEYYVVESTPIRPDPVYSSWISWYGKSSDWKACTLERTQYYDKKGELLKRENYKWQKIQQAWIWKKVIVENIQTLSSVTYEVTDAAINVGLTDSDFTERAMKRGYPQR